MRPTTPSDIRSSAVQKLREKIGADSEVVFVPVHPEPGQAINDCHRIVEKKVSALGGKMVSGWLIWEYPVSMSPWQ